MQYKSFARARRFGRRSIGVPLGVFIAGIAAAVALALLLVLLALLVELLATRGATGNLMTDTWLSELSRKWTLWQDGASNSHGLLVMFAAAIALSLVAAGMLYWLEWSVQSSAVRLASALRKQIYGQAHQLGACDLFAGRKMTSSNLLQQSTDIVPPGPGGLVAIGPPCGRICPIDALAGGFDQFLPDNVHDSAGGHGMVDHHRAAQARPAECHSGGRSRAAFCRDAVGLFATESIAGQPFQRSTPAGPHV